MKRYLTQESIDNKEWNISIDYDTLEQNPRGTYGSSYAIYEQSLSVSKDIFSALPSKIYDDERISEFMGIFRREFIRCADALDNTLLLPKLHADFETDGSVDISWIANYFRAYFSFEEQEQESSYGVIESIPEENFFSTRYSPLTPDKYKEAAQEAIQFIFERI